MNIFIKQVEIKLRLVKITITEVKKIFNECKNYQAGKAMKPELIWRTAQSRTEQISKTKQLKLKLSHNGRL